MRILVECWFVARARGGVGFFHRLSWQKYPPGLGTELCFSGEEPGDGWEVCRVSQSEGSDVLTCFLGDRIDLSRCWKELRADYLAAGWSLLREFTDSDEDEDRDPPWLRDCHGRG